MHETGPSRLCVDAYGKLSRYWIDPTVKTRKCKTIKKADPKLLAVYRANKERIDYELRKGISLQDDQPLPTV